jgi:hypothetical protein
LISILRSTPSQLYINDYEFRKKHRRCWANSGKVNKGSSKTMDKTLVFSTSQTRHTSSIAGGQTA